MIVVDTHSLIWAVQLDPKLGSAARKIIADAAEAASVLVPAMAIWEVAMLAERGRVTLGTETRRWIETVLAQPGIALAPLAPEIAIDANRLHDWAHKDPADRIIVATARHHRMPLVTADRAILDYAHRGGFETVDATR